MKIGVFDSGLGGLTILNAIRNHLPQYDYIYYGDTANLPYGDKDEDLIRSLTRQGLENLFAQGAGIIVVACNTASAETVRTLQDTILKGKYAKRRILGVIVPTIEELLMRTPARALLIGTTRTIESRKYERELAIRGGAEILITSRATPTLVPLIEANDLKGAYAYLERLLVPKVGEVDTLILGCTHYTVLKDWLRSRFPRLRVLSQDEIIPRKLEAYLQAHGELQKKLSQGNSCEYIFTGERTGQLAAARE
jgi:glutamate racemase